MGCGGSKPDEAYKGSSDSTKPEQVDMSLNKEKRMSMTKRRAAVRAEVDDELTSDAMRSDGVPKSDDDKQKIKDALTKTEVFGQCNAEQLAFLIDQAIPLPVETGEIVIKQGESGDHLYLVDTGKFEASLSQTQQVVASYGEADSFGELALLYNAPRAATVTCIETGSVWAIERKRFRYIMVQTGAASHEKKVDGFLKSVSLLSVLTDEQRTTLSNSIEEQRYTDSEYVCEVGDIADLMYFVKSGEVVATIGSEKKEVARYKAGDAFGESCLEPSADTATRKANIVAVGTVTLLKLSAEAFKEQLGSLAEVTSKNFKRKVMSAVEIEGTKMFEAFSPAQQDDLIDALEEKSYSKGSVVIAQGSSNDTFYLIKTGTAKVMQKGAPGVAHDVERELSQLEQSQYFGERSILQNDDAMASIVAGDDGLTCFTLHRDKFLSTLEKWSSVSVRDLLDAAVKKRELQAAAPERPKWADLELRRILGVGTFGRVKLVVHKSTNTTYALKCMRKAQVVATKQQSHVLNEKNILAMMEHPFVLSLVQTYQDAGELYMLMEIALGGELFTLLAKRAPLFDSPARFYTASVVSMFSYMHAHKVIYRDLKPENLILDGQGYLKLVDFGFAKILQDRTWTLCGTPEYLAPEIILNKGHGFGADWWCVGILAFECLTGTTPFVSNDPMETYRKIIKCRVPWPAQLMSLTKDFIDRLLCVDPSRRLGCLKGGSTDVRKHPWFQGLTWKTLEDKQLPAPYVPKIKSNTDDSNFDTYTDESKLNYPQEDFPKDMFAEFADVWVN